MNTQNSSTPLVTISLDTEIGGWDYDSETGKPAGSSRTIAGAVIELAARNLVTVLKDEVVKVAIAKVDAEITSQVREMVASVLSEPFRMVDRWGARSDGETTIRERIAEQITKELQPDEGDRYGANKPIITLILEREVKNAISADLTGVVKTARDKVVSQVQAHAAELLAKAVKDGLR